jgi:hypothetical protein
VLHLVVDAATGPEGFGLGIRGEIMKIGLQEPEGLSQGEASISHQGISFQVK